MEALKNLNNMTKMVIGIILSFMAVNIAADKSCSNVAVLAHLTGIGLSGAAAYQHGKEKGSSTKPVATTIPIESRPATITESPTNVITVNPVISTAKIEPEVKVAVETPAPATTPIKPAVVTKPTKVEAKETVSPYWDRLNAEAEDENTGAYLLKGLIGSKWHPNLNIKGSHIVDVSYVDGGAIEYKDGIVPTTAQLFIEVERPVTWQEANAWVKDCNYLQQSTAISSGERAFKYSPSILTKIKAEGHLVIVAISDGAFVC